ncbi:MAG: MoaD/ThiS family protein [Candidatus Binatia bacterium]
MPVLKMLGGLRRFGSGEYRLCGTTVAAALNEAPVPATILFPDGQLNRDIEVLVNGRNIAFLAGLDTPLEAGDRLTIFLHGARGYPGG